ncbi:MAG: lamin tail domain-containing protein [Lutibacter sp.]|uniref:lamin tail domain-containing protein n=1 Tax=Lutibacter sp. TaxID=1925666 RepID=UPI00385A3044
MKNNKYLILGLLLTLFSVVGCTTDEVFQQDAPDVATSEVKLNEIMSTGSPDWIELYNGGTEAVNLAGYKLTDSSQEWTIDALTIPAGGYVSFDADDSNVANVSTNFKISSGGEKITLYNADGELIDEITTPDMAAQVGLTYGREIDGGDVWVVQGASKGVANSNVNNAPVLIAEPLTEFIDVYEVTASDADGIASVKLVYLANGGVQSIDMALVSGKYKASVPKSNVGSIVNYYVVATDTTGKVSYYPEDGSNNPAEFIVAGGLNELDIQGENAGFRGVVTFTTTPYYPEQVDEIRLYYLLPGELQDDVNDDKTKVVLTKNGDTFSGVIPAQNTDDVVSYYLRVEYLDGTKTYYPIEEDGGDFNHDLGTTWPSYTIEAITYADVVNTTVNYTAGPLTSVVFPSNPVPGTDINVVLAYTSTENIDEARIYFDVGDAPVYVKANKVKGEDDASFTQTGVTVNLKDEVADNGLAVGETGNKTSFYVRIATATAEYYYGSDGSMYLDDTPGGGSTDQSDDFKADTNLWNVLNVQ